MKFSIDKFEIFGNRNKDSHADENTKRIKQSFKNARYVDSYHITPMNENIKSKDKKTYSSHTIQSHTKNDTKDEITSKDIIKAFENKKKSTEKRLPSNIIFN